MGATWRGAAALLPRRAGAACCDMNSWQVRPHGCATDTPSRSTTLHPAATVDSSSERVPSSAQWGGDSAQVSAAVSLTNRFHCIAQPCGAPGFAGPARGGTARLLGKAGCPAACCAHPVAPMRRGSPAEACPGACCSPSRFMSSMYSTPRWQAASSPGWNTGLPSCRGGASGWASNTPRFNTLAGFLVLDSCHCYTAGAAWCAWVCS